MTILASDVSSNQSTINVAKHSRNLDTGSTNTDKIIIASGFNHAQHIVAPVSISAPTSTDDISDTVHFEKPVGVKFGAIKKQTVPKKSSNSATDILTTNTPAIKSSKSISKGRKRKPHPIETITAKKSLRGMILPPSKYSSNTEYFTFMVFMRKQQQGLGLQLQKLGN